MTEQMSVYHGHHPWPPVPYVTLMWQAHTIPKKGQRMPVPHLIKIIAQVIAKTRPFGHFWDRLPTPMAPASVIISMSVIWRMPFCAGLFISWQGIHSGCGYSHGYSVNDVIYASKRHFGDFNVIASYRRDGDPPQLIANAKRIQDTLGWTPKYNDLDGIIHSAISFEQTL